MKVVSFKASRGRNVDFGNVEELGFRGVRLRA